jgi:hypothetical protein
VVGRKKDSRTTEKKGSCAFEEEGNRRDYVVKSGSFSEENRSIQIFTPTVSSFIGDFGLTGGLSWSSRSVIESIRFCFGRVAEIRSDLSD